MMMEWVMCRKVTTDYIYMDFVQALKKSKCKLERLSLKGYYAEPEVMIAISKIKSLKTFRISEARRIVLTPEVVNSFAQNENQLVFRQNYKRKLENSSALTRFYSY